MSIASDIIRGHTDAIILARLSAGDSYGYEINKAKGYRRLGNDARGGIAQGLSRFVFVKQYDLRVQFTHSSVKICTDVSPSNCGSFTAITSEREVGMFLPT